MHIEEDIDNGREKPYIMRMADHYGTDSPNMPQDYELDEVLELTELEQLKAIGDPTRQKILGLVGQRAASIKDLAEALGLPKGTVGHHLKALEAPGLVRVVRTRQVRAITEKFYGRVARTFRVSGGEHMPGMSVEPLPYDIAAVPLRQALSEMLPPGGENDPSTLLITHARVPASQARRFAKRLEALAEEFGRQSVPGEREYGLVAGVYLTSRPALPADEAAEEEEK